MVDPVGAALLKEVGKHNCQVTLNAQLDRIEHFKERFAIRGFSPSEVVIFVANADDPHGKPLLEKIMPDTDWQAMRDQGQVPFGRGLVARDFIQTVLPSFDQEAADKLKGMEQLAVVVIDHGVAEIFSA